MYAEIIRKIIREWAEIFSAVVTTPTQTRSENGAGVEATGMVRASCSSVDA